MRERETGTIALAGPLWNARVRSEIEPPCAPTPGSNRIERGIRRRASATARGCVAPITAPTDDKPTVTLEPPRDPDRVSSFLNIRVADINGVYEQWRARGADFLTPPTDRGQELRCYMRDPDGHLIEVGQATRIPVQGSSLS